MQLSTRVSLPPTSTPAHDFPNDRLYAEDQSQPRSPYLSTSSPRPSSIASALDDILLPGDYVVEGGLLQGEFIRRVSLGCTPRSSLEDGSGQCSTQPQSTFQVVRRLGTGSYAVVYLVREVLSPLSSAASDEGSVLGSMDLGGSPVRSRPQSAVYGREYAIKCLSKANLDEDQLAAQMTEVKIHQSLHSHPNIVTLHRTLETPSFLLLLLEYVPGEDLFYFLEQDRDRVDPLMPTDSESMASNTPPTPSLLSTLHPSQLLSRTRHRLVASMFAQMCEAVAQAHGQGVYHRDIKPENFIVTDGYVERPDGSRERKVFVKLTDFGLSTTDRDSADMDCGSAPYMSFECRNNVAPSYRTDAADVWSLGIVLINMLYHHNPWTDTSEGACGSFALFRSDPVTFFMTRFAGMTKVVAEYLANKVFCILEDGKGPTGAKRASAHELGLWIHSLPDLLAQPIDAFNKRHQRVLSTTSIDHPVSTLSQVSHRPCSRNPSTNTNAIRTPALRSRSVSRAPSGVGLPTYDRQDLSELSTLLDQSIEESFSQEHLPLPEDVLDHPPIQDTASPEDSPSPSRSASVKRRGKRGRKGKGNTSSISVASTPTTSEMLAQASQSLARELSSKSRPPSVMSGTSSRSRRSNYRAEPVSLYPVPMALLSSNPMSPPPLPALATSLAHPEQPPAKNPASSPLTPSKKTSIWKLSIGKSKGATTAPAVEEPQQPAPPTPITPPAGFVAKTEKQQASSASSIHSSSSSHKQPPVMGVTMSATASNVTSLLMGLNGPAGPVSSPDASWGRGRRNRGSPGPSNRPPTTGPPSRSPAGHSSHSRSRGRFGPSITDIPVPPLPSTSPSRNTNGFFSSPNHSTDNYPATFETRRGRSPHSSRSGKAPSIASSSASSNWRSSMSSTTSAYTSTSAFTSYSNASSRSVSTTATSVSGHSSWRQHGGKDTASISSASSGGSRNHPNHPNIPRNIKIMSGVPEELVTLPRDPYGPGSSSGRKQRSKKVKEVTPLGTISESRSGGGGGASSPEAFGGFGVGGGLKSPSLLSEEDSGSPPGDGKVKNGQINALAKLLRFNRNHN